MKAVPEVSPLTSSPQPALRARGAFPYHRWDARLRGLSAAYRKAQPSPLVHLEDFLEHDSALAIAEEFPQRNANGWTHYKHHNENKLGMTKREHFPQRLAALVDELNSPHFVDWISKLTGIHGLVSDAGLAGGGLHQSSRGGFLNLHADFTTHHYHRNWRRRVNLVLYLTPEWQEEWGGALEFWERNMRGCVTMFPPLFNHVVIFNTDDRSLHGFPRPIECPEGKTRNSLALYYYTVETGKKLVSRATDYRAHPDDGAMKSAMIWLDKQAVGLYSRMKTRFGFSDEVISKLLRTISRRD